MKKFDQRTFQVPDLVDVWIGENVVIEQGAVVGVKTAGCEEPVVLEDGVRICSGAVIYAGCRIGAGTAIYHNTILMQDCKIGRNCKIGTLCHLQGNITMGDSVTVVNLCHLTSHMEIGDGVFISLGVFSGNHPRPGGRMHNIHAGLLAAPKIKKGARIGAMSMLMPGVTIGQEALIGAGSVVRADVGDFRVAAGIPARELWEIDDSERIDWSKVAEACQEDTNDVR